MVKKKSSKQKSTLPKEFSSSPFKDLKGLSVFTEQQPREQEEGKQTAIKIENQTVSDAQHSFADEMDFLGVNPLPGRDRAEPVSTKTLDATTSPSVPPCEENEAAVFLDAVGSVEKIFKDEWTEDEPVKQAVPRRMKQVERGLLKPEAELDLHGLTVSESQAKVRFFLQDAIYQGFQIVLIVTGKGLHSNDGPVLRQVMERLLDQQREQVLEWAVAPRRYGGGGALLVFLRRFHA